MWVVRTSEPITSFQTIALQRTPGVALGHQAWGVCRAMGLKLHPVVVMHRGPWRPSVGPKDGLCQPGLTPGSKGKMACSEREQKASRITGVKPQSGSWLVTEPATRPTLTHGLHPPSALTPPMHPPTLGISAALLFTETVISSTLDCENIKQAPW